MLVIFPHQEFKLSYIASVDPGATRIHEPVPAASKQKTGFCRVAKLGIPPGRHSILNLPLQGKGVPEH